jgi:hypothetical protein
LEDFGVQFRVPEDVGNLALSVVVYAGKPQRSKTLVSKALALHKPAASPKANKIPDLWRSGHILCPFYFGANYRIRGNHFAMRVRLVSEKLRDR